MADPRKKTAKLSKADLEGMRRDRDLDEAQAEATVCLRKSIRFRERIKRTAERAVADFESWADDDFETPQLGIA